MNEQVNAIELEHVYKSYADFELNDISMTLPKGYIMGFIGKNGAGKTTTIRSMLGLTDVNRGLIKLLGEDMRSVSHISGHRQVMEKIGVVMDDMGFPDDVGARDVERIMKNIYRTWNTEKYNDYLNRFELPTEKKIKEYSKGMKRKLAIAAALSHDCSLLILDEATSGLDPIAREEILDIFREFIQDEKHSVLISSHILSDLEKICDYITFIDRGKIVFSSSKDELTEMYGILKCSREELEAVDEEAVISIRENKFGIEALVLRDGVNQAFTVDDAAIEDIMIYFLREGEQ